MELWDIYDENKQPTGRTMRRNDWHMKPGEFHLTVLGVIARPGWDLSYHKTCHDEAGHRLVGGFRRRGTGRRELLGGRAP